MTMRLTLILTAAILASGCDDGRPTTYPVTGKVVFEDNGFPRFGDIEFFEPNLEINARGKIARDGSFTLGTYEKSDGAVAGQHKVVILQLTRNHFAAQVEDQIVHDHGELVDESYGDYRTSKLTANVEANEGNEIVLVVRKMPKKEATGAD